MTTQLKADKANELLELIYERRGYVNDELFYDIERHLNYGDRKLTFDPVADPETVIYELRKELEAKDRQLKEICKIAFKFKQQLNKLTKGNTTEF